MRKLLYNTTIRSSLLLAVLVLAQFRLITPPAYAASQAQDATITAQTGGNTPLGGGVTFGNASGNATDVTPENEYYVYAWDVDLTQPPCTNAQLTGLHIVADTVVDTEGDPDGVTLTVMTGPSGSTTPLTTYSPPVSGQDTGTGIGRLNTSTPNPPTILDLGIAGPLETTWDLTGYDINDPLTIAVAHDAQDGTAGEQTTLSTVQLIYDDAECHYDGAVTKTLLSPNSVHPGGQATYEITVTNNGNEPIPFVIFDVASPELTYQTMTSDEPDAECINVGTIRDTLSGDPGALLAYHNHDTYGVLSCGNEQSIPPGESASLQITFAVAGDATNITNFVMAATEQGGVMDPGMQAIMDAFSLLSEDGPDIIDLFASGTLVTDNMALVSYDFSHPTTTASDDKLADTGNSLLMLSMLTGVFLVAAFAAAQRYTGRYSL